MDVNDSKKQGETANYNIYTYFDLLIPFWFFSDKNEGILWFSGTKVLAITRKYLPFFLILLLHCLTFFLVFIYDIKTALYNFLPITATALISEILVLSYVYTSRNFYSDNVGKLYQQLEEYQQFKKDNPTEKSEELDNNNVPEDFRKWYFKDHLIPMFGRIKNTGIKLQLNLKGERNYLIYSCVFVIIWSSFAIPFYYQNALYWTARILNFIIYWFIVTYALRVIYNSVKIIEDYEKQGLSAPFSKFNNYGFEFLIRAWKRMMYYFAPFWVLNMAFTGLSYRHSILLDLLYSFAAVFLAGYWSLKITKRTLSLSRKVRRESLRSKYEKIIMEKRDAFIDNPTQSSLFDINRTMKMFRSYENVMFKEFNVNNLIAIFLNIWVALIPLLYWLLFTVLYNPLKLGDLYGFLFVAS